jgi:DNA-binding transcriptional LysR family regulator
MDLRHLRYIVAAARNSSFSAAENEFNVRQPIVSKRIKETENDSVCVCSSGLPPERD